MYVTELIAPMVCTTSDPFLHGATPISTIEHEKLAHVLDEHSALLGLPQAVPYADELGVNLPR